MSKTDNTPKSMIELDDWGIGSSITGWTVYKKINVKDKEQWQARWYYSSFKNCVDALIKKQIRISNYSSLEELADNISQIESRVMTALEKHGVSPEL